MLSSERVRAALHHLWIGAAGTSLRDEDRKKAIEVEAFLLLLARAVGRSPRVLVDAAAGKGYVGLLAAELVLPPGSRVIVLERDPARVEATRAATERLAPREVGIEIRSGDVADASLWPDAPDLVTALHACGPASDAILAAAIRARARLLYLVPCCTSREVPATSAAARHGEILGIPRHAPVRRAFVEAIIAAERTLRLEAAGYETVVEPLVPPTVTPYHLVWRARRVGEPTRAAEATKRLARLTQGGGVFDPPAGPPS